MADLSFNSHPGWPLGALLATEREISVATGLVLARGDFHGMLRGDRCCWQRESRNKKFKKKEEREREREELRGEGASSAVS